MSNSKNTNQKNDVYETVENPRMANDNVKIEEVTKKRSLMGHLKDAVVDWGTEHNITKKKLITTFAIAGAVVSGIAIVVESSRLSNADENDTKDTIDSNDYNFIDSYVEVEESDTESSDDTLTEEDSES